MTDRSRLQKLQQIAQLLKDRDLAKLGSASAQKNQTEELIAALGKTHSFQGLDPVLAAQIADRFGLWITNRRITLNQQLARDTVSWMDAKAKAQLSFGRSEVLTKLEKRL